MSSLVELDIDGAIATIRLNDPDRRNSLSPEMVDALIDTLSTIDHDPMLRCAILVGAGSAFCTGGNPKRMLQPGLYPDMSIDELEDFYRTGIQRLPIAFQALKLPIIAAVNGPAIGAGLDLSCMCDLRIASQAASFASSFVKFGLVPGDGGAWLLPHAIGMANAAEMVLTGDSIDAAEALRIGLVSRVVAAEELGTTATALARRVAANAPHAVRMAKSLLLKSSQASLPDALATARKMQATAHKTEDHREAVMAFLEKRPPQFQGR